MVSAPVFGHGAVPVRVKIFVSILLAYALVGLIPQPLPPHITEPAMLMVAVIIEVLTGVVIGFAAQFIFWTIQFAGEVIGYQMGLTMAKVFNPLEGSHSNPVGRALSLTFMIVFLVLNGHHHILQALMASFEVVPLAGAHLASGGPLLLKWTGTLFISALRIAAPFMTTIFLVDLALGVFARVAPQADLFSMGFPLKILIGMGMVIIFMQNFIPIIPEMTAQVLSDVLEMIESLVPTV